MGAVKESIFEIPLLREYWEHLSERRPAPAWDLQQALFSALGVNGLEVSRFVLEKRPAFDAFEQWILDGHNGQMDEGELERLRRALAGETVGSAAGNLDNVEGLSEEDLRHWDEYGYVILRNAVSPEQAAAAAAAVYEHLGAVPDDPGSWYRNPQGHSIWVRTLMNPAFVANRKTPRVVKAFAQLWGREDLWPTIDQGGLNPPEKPGWLFPGPHLHWDYSLARPHTLDIQGILYLTDTPAHQGAFCCIPGFHRTLGDWLDALPEGSHPREAILGHAGAQPIAAGAGDLVIWHAMLPHGSSPNRGVLPRVVQYLSMRPTRWERTETWL
ncbi:phytanoyl-CoA dioxygenase family protein [Terriglobus tenax]|uniref:phytanoyl-CoA dioxygenase family protein n=1 Tax=Terriglobus tenax TaxID=1111115 RepID=UPI0021E023C3|nr:phytanoyl-CoA dioxygenase family protein [Terriglobus tenax]